MYRPFRILIVDDLLAQNLEQYATDQDAANNSEKAEGGLLGLVGRILRFAKGAEQSGSGTIEFFTTGEVSFHKSKSKATIRALLGKPPQIETLEDIESFIRSIDILLLDLHGVGSPPKSLCATKQDVPGASDEELDVLNTIFGGAGFYLAARSTVLRECQAVVILSAYDLHGDKSVPAEIIRFLHPLCDAKALPWTTKWSTNDKDLMLVSELIEGLFDAFTNGYINLHSLGGIEFASTHDLPVLIVGESGTGKEYIAHQIHKRWVREKMRQGVDSSSLPQRFSVVNCAGLSPNLARSELFGYLRGSFTDANEHRLGTVLSTCGLMPPNFRRRKTASIFDQTKRLKSLKEILDKFETLNSSDTEKAKEFAYRSWNTVLLAFGEDEAHSLLSDINRIARTLEERSLSIDYVDQYRRLILKSNKNNIEPVKGTEYDLQIMRSDGAKAVRNNLPLGTIFLDEFAELPVEVATLLLRYLQSFEVQPLGYPGTIFGAQVRVIAATSDPRVARLAGIDDMLGTWRSKAELSSPIRQDLVFRVMGQVIRAEPVRPESAAEIVAKMVSAYTTLDTPFWSNEAIKALGDLVQQRLEDMSRVSDSDSQELSVFGHRRQLSIFIQLVNEYVGTAHKRGIRSIGEEVMADTVKALWRSSSVRAWESDVPSQLAGMRHNLEDTPIPSVSMKKAWSLKELSANFSNNSNRYEFVVYLYKQMISNSMVPVSYEKCIEIVNSLPDKYDNAPIQSTGNNALHKLKNQVQKQLDHKGSGLLISSQRGKGYYMSVNEGYTLSDY